MKTRNVTMQKLRKLAERSIQVARRSGHLDPTIAIGGAALVAAAEAYIANYDASRAFALRQASQMAEGRAALTTLQARLRAWVAMLAEDIPNFDAATFDGAVTEPEHLLADTKRVIDIVEGQGAPLPYAAELVADLTAATDNARTQWNEARGAIVDGQRLRASTRDDALSLQGRLVAFRRMLRALVGTHHQDFQTLRASRVLSDADEVIESDDAAPPAQVAVAPALPAVAPQSNGVQANGLGPNGTHGISLPAVPPA